jgi:energy-coupling factor transport system substrate-specific component
VSRALSALIYALSAVIGIAAFAYPFILVSVPGASEQAMQAAPLLTTALLGLCLLALLIEVQGEAVSAKVVAALGMLVALASVLRFVETAIPGPGGFSPIFVPIILAGYVFGSRFGFLMGAMTLLVSALLTGGVGPWLPYQMFVSAWIGFSAGWLPHLRKSRLELVLLTTFGVCWGFLYGVLTNLYFWPFLAAGAGMRYQPGSELRVALAHYTAFYVASSFVWDLVRGAGTAVLLLVLGQPAIRALARFRDRYQFAVLEATRG